MAAIWPGLAQSIGRIGGGVAEFIGIVLTAILGMFLATFLTPPLSAPALERLVLVREADLGLLPRPAAGFWRETKAAIMAQVVALGVFTPVLVVLTMITWIAAPLAVVTVPLKFIVLAALLAWSLLDYPLSLRGASLRERVRLLLRGAPRVLGFGMAIALVFMVPLLPLLMLPVAVAAAAEIAVALEE
jgi:CysZ protein